MKKGLSRPGFTLWAKLPMEWQWVEKPLKTGFLAGVITVILVIFIPNRFTSEALILPTASKSSLGRLAAMAATFGAQIGGGEEGLSFANYEDILNSYWFHEKLLNSTFRFHQRNWRFGDELIREEKLLNYLKAPNLDRGRKSIKSMIKINTDVKTGLMTISVETLSPELSSQIAKKCIDNLQEFILTRMQTEGSQKAKFVIDRLKESTENYNRAEAELSAFMDMNRNFESSPNPPVRLKGLRLQAKLGFEQQVVSTLMSEREKALIDKANDTPVLTILDYGPLPVEKSNPRRALIVVMVAFLGTIASVLWERREWIKSKLSEVDGPE